MSRGHGKVVRKRKGDFWDAEYKTAEHLKLSTEPGEDLLKFTRYLERYYSGVYLNPKATALDLGSGNGRHIMHLAQAYGMKGIAYDSSRVAVEQAKKASGDLPIRYEIRSIAGDFDIADETVTIAMDLMTSHFLKSAERTHLRDEVARVVRPDGWFLFKTFLADDDLHVKRLLRDYPADEEGAYIHPEFGVYEYVWTEAAIEKFFGEKFLIRKIERSHRHRDRQGRANKRRTITVYMQKG